jgi:hypothetical protein
LAHKNEIQLILVKLIAILCMKYDCHAIAYAIAQFVVINLVFKIFEVFANEKKDYSHHCIHFGSLTDRLRGIPDD